MILPGARVINLTERVNQAEDGKYIFTVSGELDGEFMGEATFIDNGGVNQSSGEDFVGKEPARASIQPFQQTKYLYVFRRRTG